MAILIRSIPVLKGKTAEDFDRKAELAYEKKGTVDFSKEVEIAKKILAKAKLD